MREAEKSGKAMPMRPTSCALAAVLAATAWSAGTPAAAQAPLAAEGCIGCHGPAGAGMGAIAALAGRDAAELRALMAGFKADDRQGTIMGRVARGYTEAEIAAVAEHFSRQSR